LDILYLVYKTVIIYIFSVKKATTTSATISVGTISSSTATVS